MENWDLRVLVGGERRPREKIIKKNLTKNMKNWEIAELSDSFF